MYNYTGFFGDVEIFFRFRREGAAAYYGNWLKPSAPAQHGIVIPEADLSEWMKRFKASDPAYAEYVISCSCACDRLMEEGCAVFHGAAMLWNGRAYLFSAPSGTGKTTQLRLWQKLYGPEMKILNGDKPILQVTSKGTVIVHPSPWKGKENYGTDDISAPLGGIILLRQAQVNEITSLSPEDASRDLFGRIYSTFRTEEDIKNAGRIIRQLVSAVPVWLLRNRGDEASARLTHQFLSQQKEAGGKADPSHRELLKKTMADNSPSGISEAGAAGYRVRKGVVLFQMCGRDYLFPSKEADGLPAILFPIAPEMCAVLSGRKENADSPVEEQDPSIAEKIKRLVRLGLIEEIR